MRRFWLPISAITGELVTIDGEPLHHIRDVCRMSIGSRFEVMIEDGMARLVEIIEESKKRSLARVIESRAVAPLPRPSINLVLSLPKLPNFESVIEKCVELGVHSVTPALSDFSFLRKVDSALDGKAARWRKIVVSATQQSGRGDLMNVHPAIKLDLAVTTFNQKVQAAESVAGLFAFEGEGGATAKAGLASLRTSPGTMTDSVWLFVGSEGGFSTREVEMFRTNGLQPVTLGAQILRVETACVVLVSILKYDFDHMR